MTADRRPIAKILRRWAWSPFVVLPPILLVIVFWPRAVPQPPIFDAQMHYNFEVKRVYTVRNIIDAFERHNVVGALVSSIPNENTDLLWEANSNRVHRLFVPYRNAQDRADWFNRPEIIPYMESALATGRYRGIGEFHIPPGQVNTPVLARLAELAIEHNLLLSVHADDYAIRDLYALDPRLRIVWAHAGMTVLPQKVEQLLKKHRALSVELSHRNVAPDGKLDPAWEDLFLRYPDRFLIGTGAYSSESWYYFGLGLRHTREWLAQLPPHVAERIAWRNAQELLKARYLPASPEAG